MHVRDLYFDWQAREPATFVIERLGDVSPRPVRTDDHVARLLEAAAAEIEHSIAFWSGYQARMLAGLEPNAFTDPGGSAGGVQEIVYSHSGVALAPDEALVIEVDPAGAPLWDVQLYNRPWYEALDAGGRTTSTNHRMAVPDPDGRIRAVVSAVDPGSPNWLDTEGRDQVLATLRWWRPERLPVVTAEVVPLAEAPGAGRVTPGEREAAAPPAAGPREPSVPHVSDDVPAAPHHRGERRWPMALAVRATGHGLRTRPSCSPRTACPSTPTLAGAPSSSTT